ncbi:fasciclin domain-containing protein [Sphingobacterium faecium]|jgi:hypothetical protein|uniref:fasciclin domain-containing protein n=1 Tax=Sphingobacterium TaxID=28453 RepID=UPI0025F35AF9|nr:fasciclin domain-containing protein [Sphingobacterium sp. UBA6320]
MINVKNKISLLIVAIVVLLSSSCKKYYYDSGIHDPKFNGTTIEFLKSEGPVFDSTLTIIKLAGLEDVLQNENVTFFVPPGGSVNKAIMRLNKTLRFNGKDTVSQLTQIKPTVWRTVLSQYIFKGTNLLKDYPQRDTLAYTTFPGQNYTSFDGRLMNVGVIYNNAGGMQYAGYRQLFLAYIPDLSNPQVRLVNVPVSMSDVQTNNGAVHVLNRVKHTLGFDTESFIDLVISGGISPATP